MVQSFLKEKLIDELILTVSPVILGRGIPLFKQLDDQVECTLTGTQKFNQFVELRYKIK